MSPAGRMSHAGRLWAAMRQNTARLWTGTRIRLAHVAPVAGWIAVMAPLSVVFFSLALSSDINWIVRAALAGLGILALARPAAALLVAAALLGFGPIMSLLVGVPSIRAAEVLVVASLWGCFLRTFPKDGRYRRALTGQISAPLALFAMAAAASTVVWLHVQRVEAGYAPAFLKSLFLFLSRGYFTEPGDFWVLVSTLVLLEGLALYAAVRLLCRVDAAFFEQALRVFALGGAGVAVMSVVRLAEIQLRNPGAIAFLRTTTNGLRISPQIPDFIAAGSYFSLCWLITLGLAVASPVRRLMWLAAGAPLIAALYLTGSRSVLAAAFAGLVVLVLVVARLGSRSARAVLAAALVVVAVMVASYPWLTGRDVAGDMAKRSLQVRLELVRTSLRIMAIRPLFGVGIDRYHLWSGGLASPELRALFPARKTAHNDFLRVGAELGLVGLALFLWILAAAVRAIWLALRSTRDARLAGLAAGLAAFGVTSLVSNPLLVREVSYAFWIALGLAVAHSARLHPPHEVAGEAVPSSPWTWRVAVLVAALLVVSIPFRASQELATVDMTRLSYGLFASETDPSGTPFRWSGPEATLFVDGRARVVEIPIAGVPVPSGPPLQLELWVDGRLANRISVGPQWQRLRTLLPAEPSVRPHRIDLSVSPSWVPAEMFPGSTDHRVLGVKVGEITVIM